MRSRRRCAAAVAIVGVIAAGCGWRDGAPEQVIEDGIPRGGTLRTALLSDVTAELDPQREYFAPAWSLFRCCLLRTLLSYDVAAQGKAATRLHPDLAASLPKVSKDRRTWRFRLKDGLTYAPPLGDLEITSADIVRALERLADPDAGKGGYSFYYEPIRGFERFAAGKADSIGGLVTPDDHTLVVRLRRPVSDFGHRMTLPATAPIPAIAARGHDDDYGRFLVSSGPYVLEGSDELDFSVRPKEQEPVSGYEPGETITLVRNPSWNPASDRLRAAHVDRIEVQLGGDGDEAGRAIDDGKLDIVLGGAPTSQISRYARHPELEKRMFVNPAGTVRYASFNLAVPPFDDVNVRRAVNHVVDKNLLLRVRGGKAAGSIAHHLIPDYLLGGRLTDYEPYAASDADGRLAAAKRAMRKSQYDRDGDGLCDGAKCRAVRAVAFADGSFPDVAGRFEADLEELGIDLDVELTDVSTAYDRCSDPRLELALCLTSGWRADFPRPYGFVRPLFAGDAVGASGCCNDSLVGASKKRLKKLGFKGVEVPNVDERIQKCEKAPPSEALDCWAELDRHLMHEVVPWVPFLNEDHIDIVSSRVSNYTFDRFSGVAALDHMAIDEREMDR